MDQHWRGFQGGNGWNGKLVADFAEKWRAQLADAMAIQIKKP